MSESTEAAANTDGAKEPDKLAAGCGLAAGGAFLLFVLAVLFSGGADDDDSSSGMAEVMCQDFVKDRLRSPSSAEFDTTANGTGPTYTVTGTVDSQNGFGAMLRNRLSCTVAYDGDGGWTLRDLQFSE